MWNNYLILTLTALGMVSCFTMPEMTAGLYAYPAGSACAWAWKELFGARNRLGRLGNRYGGNTYR